MSLKETAICIVDDGGKILFERMVPTDPQVIAKYLAKHAPGLERFGLESSSTAAWLWREFRGMGLPISSAWAGTAKRASDRLMRSSSARCCYPGSSCCSLARD